MAGVRAAIRCMHGKAPDGGIGSAWRDLSVPVGAIRRPEGEPPT